MRQRSADRRIAHIAARRPLVRVLNHRVVHFAKRMLPIPIVADRTADYARGSVAECHNRSSLGLLAMVAALSPNPTQTVRTRDPSMATAVGHTGVTALHFSNSNAQQFKCSTRKSKPIAMSPRLRHA